MRTAIRAAVLCLGIGFATLSVSIADGQSVVDAPVVRDGSLTVRPRIGPPGTDLTLTGAVGPRSRHRIVLQRREPTGRFRSLESGWTNKRGRFELHAVLPQDRVRAAYRVLSTAAPDPVAGRGRVQVTPTAVARVTGIIRLTHGRSMAVEPDVSGDGLSVAYTESKPSGQSPRGVYVWHARTGVVHHVPRSRTASRPVISDDGRFVAFDSVVPGGVYIWDRRSNTTSRVGPGEYPAISGNGRYVAYRAEDGLRLWDRVSGTTTDIGGSADFGDGSVSLSFDGRLVAFSTTPSGSPVSDVIVWDRVSGSTTVVAAGNSDSGCARISSDGRHVAFCSDASDLGPLDTNAKSDVFVWDSTTGTTTTLTQGDRDSWASSISADGRYVTIDSNARNLVTGDQAHGAQVYVWDRASGVTTPLTSGRGWSRGSQISADGRVIAFASFARDLVPHDTPGSMDCFLWNVTPPGLAP